MMKVFERYGLKDKINILYSKLGEDPIFSMSGSKA